MTKIEIPLVDHINTEKIMDCFTQQFDPSVTIIPSRFGHHFVIKDGSVSVYIKLIVKQDKAYLQVSKSIFTRLLKLILIGSVIGVLIYLLIPFFKTTRTTQDKVEYFIRNKLQLEEDTSAHSIPIGSRVKLSGLDTDPHNGQIGIVQKFYRQYGHYEVQLVDSNEAKFVKSKNLILGS